MNRPLSENCRALDLGFDVRLISPISGVEQFPRTHGESDIISGLSGQIVASPQTPGMLALAAAGVFYYVFNYGVAFAMEKCEKAFAYYN